MIGGWRDPVLARIAARALHRRARELDLEQAVKGIDVLPEVELQSLIAGALEWPNLGVHREVPYPGGRRLSRGDPGPRCDLVLTPRRGQAIVIPGREFGGDPHGGTLFDPPTIDAVVGPESCYWLEVKVVRQFTSTGRAPGPNQEYASQLVRSIRSDLRKLEADEGIHAGGLMLILFTADRSIARHDVAQAADRAARDGVCTLWHTDCWFAITDRMGHACCSVVLFSAGNAPAAGSL